MKAQNDYVIRLECCGIAAHNAVMIVFDFEKNYSGDDLEAFIRSIEEDSYVDQLQC